MNRKSQLLYNQESASQQYLTPLRTKGSKFKSRNGWHGPIQPLDSQRSVSTAKTTKKTKRRV